MSRKNFVRVITTVITAVFIIISGVSTVPAEAATAPVYESGVSISTQTSGADELPNAWVTTYAISNGRVTTYSSEGAVYGWIDGSADKCQVNFCKSAHGRVIVKYPTNKGTKTAYAPASAFISNTSYNRYTGTLSNNTAVYTKIN